MNSYSVRFALFAAAALVAFPSAQAQDVKPAAGNTGSVHRLEIVNGPSRTVHLVGRNVAAADQQLLRDLERAENDLALVNGLQSLRVEYVNHEKRLERQRFETNYRQAGTTHAFAPGIYPDLVPVVDPRILFQNEYGGWGSSWFGGFGWGGFPGSGFAYTPQATGSGSMYSNSVVEPGPLATELVKGLAARVTPEYAEQANRNYATARSAALKSDSLAKALGQPFGDVRPASADVPRRSGPPKR